jgi:hypothetical protein
MTEVINSREPSLLADDDLSFIPHEATPSELDVTSEYMNEYAEVRGQKKSRVHSVYMPVRSIDSNRFKLPAHVIASGFVKVNFYDSGHNQGAYIYHAMTGQRSNYRLGQRQQDLFFKVADATHSTDAGPHTLFYNSPEEYERHFLTVLPEQIKNKWHEKYMVAKKEFM